MEESVPRRRVESRSIKAGRSSSYEFGDSIHGGCFFVDAVLVFLYGMRRAFDPRAGRTGGVAEGRLSVHETVDG